MNNHLSEQRSTQPQTTTTVGDESAKLTGVGRTVTEGDVMRVIDEAHWKPKIQIDTNRSFALVISTSGEKEQVLVKSPFLASLFEDVIKRTGMMGMTMGSEGISFPEPYVPLYWCYSHIIQSGSEIEHSSEQDIKDLQSLRYWYERWVLPAHDQTRETIHSGFISFDDLWALFRPGETVYTEDNFQQPELSIVTEVSYEFSDPPTPPQAGPMKASAFCVSSWYQSWDPSRQMFVRELAMKTITSFEGSRRISDLEEYPVRFFAGGDEGQIETLQQRLEHRGRRWKDLFGPSVQHLYHEGPATTESSGIFKNNRMYDDMRYDGQSEVHVRHDTI